MRKTFSSSEPRPIRTTPAIIRRRYWARLRFGWATISTSISSVRGCFDRKRNVFERRSRVGDWTADECGLSGIADVTRAGRNVNRDPRRTLMRQPPNEKPRTIPGPKCGAMRENQDQKWPKL